MNNRMRVSIIAITFFATSMPLMQWASAQDTGPPTRELYDGESTLPDAVSFYRITAVTTMLSEDGDAETAAALIAQEMSVSTEEANSLLAKFVNANKVIKNQRAARHREIGCASGVARVYGNDAARAFNEMDDADEVVSAQNYSKFLNQLSDEDAQSLVDWVERQKLNIYQRKIDHEASYARSGKSPDALLAKICINLNQS